MAARRRGKMGGVPSSNVFVVASLMSLSLAEQIALLDAPPVGVSCWQYALPNASLSAFLDFDPEDIFNPEQEDAKNDSSAGRGHYIDVE